MTRTPLPAARLASVRSFARSVARSVARALAGSFARRAALPAALATFVLGAGLALTGCAMQTATSAPAPSDRTLYERLGGRPALIAVVDDGIANISTDPRINARFANIDAPRLKANLVDLLCVNAGGPCTYRGRNMSDAHEGMKISDAEFDALVEDLVKSLDKFKVPPREKGEVIGALGRMRNAITGH